LEFDLGNLSVYNSQHVDMPEDLNEREETIQRLARENFKRLFGRLLEVRAKEDELRDQKKLDLQIHDFDKTEFHVVLPTPVTLFPRFNPMPSKKDLTKWEKFAREKGIKKNKRTHKVFDEASQTWIMRHGSKGARQLADKRDVVRTFKPGQDLSTDLFEEERLKKQSAKQKQTIQEMRNRIRAKGHDASKVVSVEERHARINMKKDKLRKIKQDKQQKLAANLRIVQSSTASMGKFDKRVSKDEVKKAIQKRKQKVANNYDTSKEVARNKELLALIGK
jgi:regulator of ribosome biosynthesis